MPKMVGPRGETKITAWSFSRGSDYAKCPALAGYKHVMKLPEPKSPAMERGTSIHGLAEAYVRGKGRTLPRELSHPRDLGRASPEMVDLFKRRRAAFKKGRVAVEGELAFTNVWTPTGWFDRDAWWRVKMDAREFTEASGLPVALIDDYKTGKYRPEDLLKDWGYSWQLESYALAELLRSVDQSIVVAPRLVFLDLGKIVEAPQSYTAADVPGLKKLWTARTKRMLTDTRFEPTPGDHCRWCVHRKSVGGRCKF